MAVPCGGQGRKRAALGETASPGKYRDTFCADFTRKGYAASVSGKAANGCAVAAANRWLMKASSTGR